MREKIRDSSLKENRKRCDTFSLKLSKHRSVFYNEIRPQLIYPSQRGGVSQTSGSGQDKATQHPRQCQRPKFHRKALYLSAVGRTRRDVRQTRLSVTSLFSTFPPAVTIRKPPPFLRLRLRRESEGREMGAIRERAVATRRLRVRAWGG